MFPTVAAPVFTIPGYEALRNFFAVIKVCIARREADQNKSPLWDRWSYFSSERSKLKYWERDYLIHFQTSYIYQSSIPQFLAAQNCQSNIKMKTEVWL
jgi:hypothetical protein